jgi:hypothetical protein
MSSEFHASIAFVPLSKDGILPANLKDAVINADGQPDTTMLQTVAPEFERAWFSSDNDVYDSSVRKDTPEYLEITMVTNYESNREWAEAVSQAFPTVRLALRGDNDDNAYSEHYLLVGGKYRRNQVQNRPNLAHLKMIAKVWTDHDYLGTWTGHNYNEREYGAEYGPYRFDWNIREVLKAKSASTELLHNMKQNLLLTPEQEALLLAHPKYDPNFVPNADWWLGKR